MKRILNRLGTSPEGFLYLAIVANICSIVGMGLNYLFNIVMARSLSLEDFGRFGIAVAYLSIATIPGGSLGTVLTREFALMQERQNDIAAMAKKYAKKSAVYAAGVAFPAILLSMAFGKPEIALALLILPLSYAIVPLQSVFQAKEDITTLSLIGLVGIVLKLLFGIGLVFLGFGLFGAIAGFALPALIMLPVAAYLLRKTLRRAGNCTKGLKKEFVILTALLVVQGLFLYADLFFVQYFLGNAQAGLYTVAETTAKITFFLSSAVTVVVFPKAAKLGPKDWRGAAKLLAGSALFLVPPAVIFMLFPNQFIALFYGEKFAPAAAAFFGLAAGFLIYALFNIVQSMLLARKEEKAVLALTVAGLFLHCGLLYALVPTSGLTGAAMAVVASSGALLAAGSAVLARQLTATNKKV